MNAPVAPGRAYLSALRGPTGASISTVRRELGLRRTAAAESFAATAALVPAALSRLTKDHTSDPWACVEVVREHGRPADLEAPGFGIPGRLARPGLSEEIDGLLGPAGPRASKWLAYRTGAAEEDLGKAVAAVAPIVLAAMGTALPGRALADWVSMMPDGALDDPARLLDANEEPAEIFRRVRRRGLPWIVRVLGVGG